MTTGTAPATPPAVRAVYDLRRTRRLLTALLLPLGPAAIAVARYVLPYDSTSTAREVVDGIAANPGAQLAVTWLGAVALFTLVPGAMAAVRLAQRHAPRLALVAGVLLVAGYLALFGGGDSDATIRAGLDTGVPRPVLAELAEAAVSAPGSALLGIVFVVGHIVGTVLLAIALRPVLNRAWVVLLAVSQPLHLVAALTANHPLDLLAWGLTAGGMAAVAVVLLRTPDDEWDLPPLAPGLRLQ